jgi:hypothetical protein
MAKKVSRQKMTHTRMITAIKVGYLRVICYFCTVMLSSLALHFWINLRRSRPVYWIVLSWWTPDDQFSHNLSIKVQNVGLSTSIFSEQER